MKHIQEIRLGTVYIDYVNSPDSDRLEHLRLIIKEAFPFSSRVPKGDNRIYGRGINGVARDDWTGLTGSPLRLPSYPISYFLDTELTYQIF